MADIVEIVNSNEDNENILIIYDKTSVDSLYSSFILKYVCEEMTDAVETVECKDITEIDSITFSENAALTYTKINFVGCIPTKEQAIYIDSLYGSKVLYILCDADDYSFVKSISNRINIEYIENDSCFLHLYKIAFGQFNDSIPQIVKDISINTIKVFDDNYNDYIKHQLSVVAYFMNESTPYDSLYTTIKTNLFDKENTSYALTDIISVDMMQYSSVIINKNLNIIKNDPWKINSVGKAYVIYSNGEIIIDGLTELTDADVILNFYRKNADYWAIELFKIEHPEYQTTKVENEARIAEIKEALNGEINITTEVNLTKEKKALEAENKKLEKLIGFNCGNYAKNYRGKGSETHGYIKLNNKAFRKYTELKAL